MRCSQSSWWCYCLLVHEFVLKSSRLNLLLTPRFSFVTKFYTNGASEWLKCPFLVASCSPKSPSAQLSCMVIPSALKSPPALSKCRLICMWIWTKMYYYLSLIIFTLQSEKSMISDRSCQCAHYLMISPFFSTRISPDLISLQYTWAKICLQG